MDSNHPNSQHNSAAHIELARRWSRRWRSMSQIEKDRKPSTVSGAERVQQNMKREKPFYFVSSNIVDAIKFPVRAEIEKKNKKRFWIVRDSATVRAVCHLLFGSRTHSKCASILLSNDQKTSYFFFWFGRSFYLTRPMKCFHRHSVYLVHTESARYKVEHQWNAVCAIAEMFNFFPLLRAAENVITHKIKMSECVSHVNPLCVFYIYIKSTLREFALDACVHSWSAFWATNQKE